MRVGEALALNDGDIDLTRALLTIRQAKGNKSRIVPLHPSTITALRRYASIRDSVYVRCRPAQWAAKVEEFRWLDDLILPVSMTAACRRFEKGRGFQFLIALAIAVCGGGFIFGLILVVRAFLRAGIL